MTLNLLIYAGHVALAVHAVTDDLTEEVGEVHGDEDEHKEVIEQSDDAEQCLGEQIQGREEVSDPDQSKDHHPDLEGGVDTFPSPEGAPEVSEQHGQVPKVLGEGARLTREPPVVLADLPQELGPGLDLSRFRGVPLVLAEVSEQDGDPLAAVRAGYGGEHGGAAVNLQERSVRFSRVSDSLS